MLRVINVSKAYDGYPEVLSNINMHINKGEIVGIVGLNGAGKSTLLRAMTGVIDVTGTILFQGKDIRNIGETQKKKIALLNTMFNIYENLSVTDNLEIFRLIYGATINQKNNIIKMLGIDAYLEKKVSKLSTGMRKRVEIACTTMHDFDLLLLDEPTNGLDIESKEQILNYFKNLNNNKIIIITSHNVNDIERLCNRVYILKEGRIIKEATVDMIKYVSMSDINEWIITLYIRPDLLELLKYYNYRYRIKDRIVEVLVNNIQKQEVIRNLANYDIISICKNSPNFEDAILNMVHGR